MRTRRLATLAVALAALAPPSAAEEAEPAAPLSDLPIREVTVFKDGHAFVVHHGKVPVDARGDAVVDELPSPVLGTFWPFATGDRARLRSVVAGKRKFTTSRPIAGIADTIEANPGVRVWVREAGKPAFAATAESVTRRAGGPLAADATVAIRTEDGARTVPLHAVEGVLLPADAKTEVRSEEEKDAFTLHLDWPGGKPEAETEIGMGYLQKGLRWIPSYRIEIDGAGRAQVRLQATLLNELADLEDVTLHLVIGVPSFDFRGTLDPMAIQRALAPLSPYFQADPGLSNGAIASNFVFTQRVARSGEMRAEPAPGAPEPPELPGEQAEDLHVFTVKGVHLRRGERMVVPVSEATVAYEDAYTLSLPFAPPREVLRDGNDPRARELLRLLRSPKTLHALRLRNPGPAPLTTAPALVLKDGRILGQGTMTYTAPGSTVDLGVTAALAVRAERRDRETGRIEKALRHNREDFFRIDMEGTVTLVNSGSRAVVVEVSRWVPGPVDSADHDGKTVAVDARDDDGWLPASEAPWGSWNWPSWWIGLNGATEITWKVTVPAGKTETLAYAWHYFWR
jgi:hypothetical protein